ncbi:MAG TPA: C-GCAxxG-C-C family (seleno)protein [Anaerolineae bacterium]|nr:C-GCAxxG-C-C family (seleno)protein [Anaerolineae bacterium]HQI86579.1 C-GCAxxG-C-C family (seleno)protein [Anaerolineae bacterium]
MTNNMEALIKQRVAAYFISGDNNCAMTVLRVLAEVFDTPVAQPVIDAAQCMPGAGGVEHLCGLVSGVLMFVGVWGGQQGLHRQKLRPLTVNLSQAIQERFGSLMCRDLRPAEGCGPLAVAFLTFVIPYLESRLNV